MLLPSCIRDVTAKDYAEPLLNRQPPLSSHLPVSQGWPALNGGATLLSLQILLKICWNNLDTSCRAFIKSSKLSYLSFSCVLLWQRFTECFLCIKGQEEWNLQQCWKKYMGKKPDHWQGSVRILQGAEKDIEGVNCHLNKELLDTKESLSAQWFERKEEKNTSYSILIPVQEKLVILDHILWLCCLLRW